MKEFAKGLAVVLGVAASILFLGPMVLGAGLWWIERVFKFFGL